MMRAGVIAAIFRRNLAGYFAGSLGSLIILVFVAAAATRTFNSAFFANNLATLDQLTAVFPQLLLFLVPAITMGVWAEERRQGTDELLFTMPATDVEILLGKYLSVVAVYTIALAFTFPKLLVLEYYANPDWNLLVTTYTGYWFCGLAMLGAGMFASSLIANTTAAFVLGVAVCSIPVFIGDLSFGNRAVESLSMQHHLAEFGVGLVPFGGLLYFVSVAAFSLYLNYVVITRRHWAADRTARMGGHYLVRIACLLTAIVSINYAIRRGSDVATLAVDATSEGLHTLSDETRAIVRAIPDEGAVTIKAYVTPNLPRENVDQGQALARLLGQYRRIGNGKVVVNWYDTEPHSKTAGEAETFGITPRTVEHSDETGQRRDEVFLSAVVSGPEGEVVIPFLESGASVEHEITRAVATVTQRRRLVVGILETPAAEMLDVSGRQRKSAFVESLERHYEVETVFAGTPIRPKRDIEFALWTDEDETKWKEYLEAKKTYDQAKEAYDAEVAAREAEAAEMDDDDGGSDDSTDGDPADGDPADGATDDGPADPDGDDAADPQDGDDAAEPMDDEPKDDEPVAPIEPEKPREKPDRRSEYLDESDPVADLDDKKLSEELRRKLGWREVKLSDAATVSVVTKGKRWTITDVNPDDEYEVRLEEDDLVVGQPRYDVVIAVQPSGLTKENMDHLVEYVESGRPVLIFDDPMPLHIGGFLGLEMAPVRPNPPEQPQRPGMPPMPAPEKADEGKATTLTRALGIVWPHDEAVWDEFDPHPRNREFPADPRLEIPLLYVNADNQTPGAISPDDAITVGLREMQFIYPGRINPRTESTFEFQPLIRVGAESGTYSWDDVAIVETPPFQARSFVTGMRGNPKKSTVGGTPTEMAAVLGAAAAVEGAADPKNAGKVSKEDTRRKNGFCVAAHISAPRRIIVEMKLQSMETEEARRAAGREIEKVFSDGLGDLDGIDKIETKIQVRSGTGYAVTKLDIAKSVDDDDDDAEDSDLGDDETKDERSTVKSLLAKVKQDVADLKFEKVSGKPTIVAERARQAVYVADVDMIGYIPFVHYQEEEDDVTLDNEAFVLNAIDVLAGRTELVRLQGRRPRHRILTEVERRKQRLAAATTNRIRVARQRADDELEKAQRRFDERQEELSRNEGLTFRERLQQQGIAIQSAQRSLDNQLERIRTDGDREVARLEAENRREVRALQNDIRSWAIGLPLIPAALFAIGLLVWRIVDERRNVDPVRSRYE